MVLLNLCAHNGPDVYKRQDVDRSSAVDEKGCEINRNGIVAMAAALIADDNPGTTVVTDLSLIHI